MKIWTIPVVVATLALTACFSGPPTPEDIGALLKARLENTGDYKVNQITISNVNCSRRESSYFCEYDSYTKGTQKKFAGFVPGTLTPNYADAPYENRSKKIHMALAKGDAGWMEVLM